MSFGMRWLGTIFGLLIIILKILLHNPSFAISYPKLILYGYASVYHYNLLGTQLSHTHLPDAQVIMSNPAQTWLIGVIDEKNADNTCQLVRYTPDGTFLNELATFNCRAYVHLSPQAEWIFYDDYTDTIFMRPDGTERHEILDTDKTYHNFISWSPDERWFIYQVEPRLDLMIVDTQTLNQTQLSFSPKFDGAPNWSPDGEWIVYASRDESDKVDLVRTRYDGTETLNLTQHPAEDGFIGWSPDYQWILFWSERDNLRAIYKVRLDGSDLQLLSTHKYFTDYFGWSPDHKWFYIKSGWNIWRIKVDGSSEEQLTDNIIVFNRPSWSAENHWIYFIGAPEPPPNIYVGSHDCKIYRMRVDGSQIEQIVSGLGGCSFNLTWSSDKQWLYINDVGSERNLSILSGNNDFQKRINVPVNLRRVRWHGTEIHSPVKISWLTGLVLLVLSNMPYLLKILPNLNGKQLIRNLCVTV